MMDEIVYALQFEAAKRSSKDQVWVRGLEDSPEKSTINEAAARRSGIIEETNNLDAEAL